MAQDLPKAAEGEGQGRGKYRYCGFEAILIAIALSELRQYGLTLVGLKTLADMLWNVFELGQRFPEIAEPLRTNAGTLAPISKRYPRQTNLLSNRETSQFDRDKIEKWLAHQLSADAQAVQLTSTSETRSILPSHSTSICSQRRSWNNPIADGSALTSANR